ncbi:UspA domain protein [Candidatus Sulfopaludibacter sp. SbA4]|nr:UspA domain protein [Candidatus Sulfopaludibacter sp. SbA4]
MYALSKILLPVDFSERSVGAAHYANLVAARFHSDLTVLHVQTPPQMEAALDTGGSMLAELYRDRSSQVSEELDRFVAAQLPGLNVQCVLLEGDPAPKIVEFARDWAAGLIVMPTHSYGPFRRFLLGSNTAKVLHDAQCPVWTGVHLLEPPPADSIPFRNILCAIDLGPQSSRTLCWAAQFALHFGARLVLVHATGPSPEPGDSSEAGWQTGMREAAEAELQRLLEFVHAEADIIVESGDPAKAIGAAAERIPADLLVIGRGSAAGVYGRLRTNAYAIIRMSVCPVVSV